MENGERKTENGKRRTENGERICFSVLHSPFSTLRSPFSTLCFLFSVLFAFSLQARMLLPSKAIPLANLTTQADAVFKAICVDKKKGTGAHPIDIYYFKVEEVLKGNLKEDQIVDLKQREFYFQLGQRYVLFLGPRDEAGMDRIAGGPRGKFWIRKEAGKEIIENPSGLPAKVTNYLDFKEEIRSGLGVKK